MVHSINQKSSNRGFTIVELLIALTVFSVILLITSGVIVELSRQFYKGTVRSRTQSVSRNIVDEIANNIQYSSSEPSQLAATGAIQNWCIANRLYSYTLGQHAPDQTPNAFVRGGDCAVLPSEPLTRSGSDVELLGDNMRISKLTIESDGTGKVWYISATVAHGDDDALNDPNSENPSCKADDSNSTYCAVSTLSTTVVRKL